MFRIIEADPMTHAAGSEGSSSFTKSSHYKMFDTDLELRLL